MKYIGIDIGKKGGMVVIDNDSIRTYQYESIEGFKQNISEEVKDSKAYILIENVHSSPQMGVTSAFSFGFSYGEITGVLHGLGIKYTTVEPQVWQRALGCLSGGDKGLLLEKAKRLAVEITSNVPRITLATADALLIAYYAMRRF